MESFFHNKDHGFIHRDDIIDNPIGAVGIAYDKKTLSLTSIMEMTSAYFHYDNIDFTTISYHGAWGCMEQHRRLCETCMISSYAASLHHPVIYGGDFTPQARSINGIML